MYAVQWAIKNGYHNLELRYDYEELKSGLKENGRQRIHLLRNMQIL